MQRIKRCSKCHIWKPLDEFHNRKKESKDGKVSQCKDCKNSYGRSYFKTTGYRKKEIEALSDNYIKQLISRTLTIPRSFISRQQIEEKRTILIKARNTTISQNPQLVKQRLLRQRSKLKNKIRKLSGKSKASERYKEQLEQLENDYLMLLSRYGDNIDTNNKRRLIDKRSKLKRKIHTNKGNLERVKEWQRQLIEVEDEYKIKYVS